MKAIAVSRDLSESGFVTRSVAYFTYPDTSGYSPTEPSSTSYLNSDAVLQVFRESWDNTSSWLSFTTWNKTTQSNRNMGHDDQLNFEYYDKGDYLIADSGEVKNRVFGYGPISSKGHNIIQINDSAKSTPSGVNKGSWGTLTTPAPSDLSLSNNIFEFAEADLNWNEFEDETSLTNPIKWRRTILFPNKEYFIVLDYLNNSVQREIDSLLHLTSFSYDESYDDTDSFSSGTDKIINSSQKSVTYAIDVSPISKSMEIRTKFKDISGSGNVNLYVNDNFVTSLTADTDYKYIRGVNYSYFVDGTNNITYNTSDDVSLTVDYTTVYSVGLVDGALEIGNSVVDWKEQTYNDEVDITNGSELKWNTTNINDNDIQMHLYHLPNSEISVEKYWIRIGGYNSNSEVDHPLIRFKKDTSDEFYGITAFYTRYTNESEWTYTNLSVSGGKGNALKISNGTWTDWVIHANKSYITADEVKTDGAYHGRLYADEYIWR